MGAPVISVLSLLLAVAAAAAPQGKSQAKGKRDSAAAVTVTIFAAQDRRLIVSYYKGQPSGLPPGLAKRDELPPGLEKQLRRNGRLPPGLDKRIAGFPIELERKLPPLPAGARRGMIGGRAVIYNPTTSVVLDVFVVF